MDSSTFNYLILFFTILCGIALFGYNYFSSKEKSIVDKEAQESRSKIDSDVEQANKGISDIQSILKGEMEKILLNKQNEWNRKFPFGWVLIGKTKHPNMSGPTKITNGSMYYFADWSKTIVEFFEEQDQGKTKEFYKITLPPYIQGTSEDFNSEDFKGFSAPSLERTIPKPKVNDPQDITIVNYYNQPHIYFEIIEERTENSELIYLLGFRSDMVYDYYHFPEKFKKDYDIDRFEELLKQYNKEFNADLKVLSEEN